MHRINLQIKTFEEARRTIDKPRSKEEYVHNVTLKKHPESLMEDENSKKVFDYFIKML